MGRQVNATSAAAIAVALVLAAGCSSGAESGEADGALEGRVLVSAAASLTDAFGELAEAFEAANPGVDVILNLAGSSALREQILGGAPVDVFASANISNLEAVLATAPATSQPEVFATSRLDVAVPAGNPGRVDSLDDLSRGDLLIGLCAEAVPCGELARDALTGSGVSASVDTFEPNARALLAKLADRELDAAITYVTDISSTGGAVESLGLSGILNTAARYHIAPMGDAPNRPAAAAFVSFVLGESGRAILAAHGFSLP